MARHLGRLKVVTKYKEGNCNYKYCTANEDKPGKIGRVLPGEKVFVLTRMGKVGTRTTIFYKNYHKECFLPWAIWTFDQIPIERRGRKVMDLSPEDKKERDRLISTRARLLRNLRTVDAESVSKVAERIADLDRQITGTGYPILQYQGRKSDSKTEYDRFWQEVKDHYKHPLRVPGTESEEAARMGMGAQFSKDMSEWNDERNRETIERQGKDYEANQEDREVE